MVEEVKSERLLQFAINQRNFIFRPIKRHFRKNI